MDIEEMENMEHVLDHEKEIKVKAKVSSKGQVVIPISIRNALDIKEGEQELLFEYKDGKLSVEKVEHLTADQLYGYFNKPEDNKDFILDLNTAREERAEAILNK